MIHLKLPSFISNVELVVFSIVVMILSGFAAYDGRMAKIKAELNNAFYFMMPVQLELLEYRALTGRWPSSEYSEYIINSDRNSLIKQTNIVNDTGNFQFILSSEYQEIDQKIMNFAPVVASHDMAFLPIRWQCRFIEAQDKLQIHRTESVESADYIPYFCRD